LYLAIDTSTDNASIAVAGEERVLAELSWYCRQNHSVELMPSIMRLLGQAGTELKALKGIVVARGPGSFNGLRVGISTAKGLAFSLNIPLAGVSTLEAAAWQHAASGLPVCPIFNAGRSEIAFAIYQQKDKEWQQLAGQQLTTVDKLCSQIKSRTIFGGEPSEGVIQQLKQKLGSKTIIPPPAARLRRAAFLAELGIKRITAGDCDPPASLQPIYMRKPPITTPKRNLRLINSQQ